MTSSLTLPKLPGSDAVAQPIRAAVTAVAEQSFFALVDKCEALDAEPDSSPWFVALVRFDDGAMTGSVTCWLPPDLAQGLFDAFSGRDPAEQLPTTLQLNDLVGEFANMVCGDWLSRFPGQRAIHLSPPLVLRAPRPAPYDPHRVWVKVNDRPLAIDWEITRALALGK